MRFGFANLLYHVVHCRRHPSPSRKHFETFSAASSATSKNEWKQKPKIVRVYVLIIIFRIQSAATVTHSHGRTRCSFICVRKTALPLARVRNLLHFHFDATLRKRFCFVSNKLLDEFATPSYASSIIVSECFLGKCAARFSSSHLS